MSRTPKEQIILAIYQQQFSPNSTTKIVAENLGIRPDYTYTIISRLYKKDFISKDGGTLYLTEKGFKTFDYLFPDIKKTTRTSHNFDYNQLAARILDEIVEVKQKYQDLVIEVEKLKAQNNALTSEKEALEISNIELSKQVRQWRIVSEETETSNLNETHIPEKTRQGLQELL